MDFDTILFFFKLDNKMCVKKDDFKVPTFFNEDLFHLVGESRRPPYRWFLIGPQRSGTTIHIDPLATSAWNTLISGKKRWVLFPPYIPKRIVKGKSVIKKGEDDEAIHYFMYILPRIKQMAIKYQNDNTVQGYHNFRCYEFTQEAGETVYIPNGWWHAVLNLTDTVGITQNFCSQNNFDEVWLKTRVGRKKMAWKWLCQLENKSSHLATRAKKMNQRDQFVMKYHPNEVKRREQEEKQKKEGKQRKKKKSKRNELCQSQIGYKQHENRFQNHILSNPSSIIPSSHSNESNDSDKNMKRRRLVSPSVSP